MKVSACGPGDYHEAGAARAESCQSVLLFRGFVCVASRCVLGLGSGSECAVETFVFSRTGKAPSITARSVEHNHKLCRGGEGRARARQKFYHSLAGTKLVSNFLYST